MTLQTRPVRTYDDPSFGAVRIWPIGTGITGTLLGTVASDAAGVELLRCPSGVGMKIIGATAKLTNGGTGVAAAPQFGLCSKLAGTGAIVTVATCLYGTRADNTYVDLTPVTTGTQNCITGGDTLHTLYVAGTTTDASEVYNLQAILYQEIYS